MSIWIEPLPGAMEPLEALERLHDLPHCLLLESASRSPQLGRCSFVTAAPFRLLRSKNGTTEVYGPDGVQRSAEDPFEVLRRALADFPLETVPGLPPFQGGAAGFFSYDLCRQIERLPAHRYDDLGLPDLCVGLYDWVLAWDHQRERCWLISTGLPASAGPERERRAAERAAAVRARLFGERERRTPMLEAASLPAGRVAPSSGPAPERFPLPEAPGVWSNFSRPAYLEMVERTREYIRAGDIFQANLSQRLEAEISTSPLDLYRRLRTRNPAPFAAYFDAGDSTVLSSSPERFLRLSGRSVETRPIKGTAPRGETPQHDAALAEALRNSAKDRAENIMIVDLLRNDLSMVCEDGSVQVPELCTVESYAKVHHLVSTVVGELRPELGAVDLLRAAFPGGSITGAPKIRAMEIIAELEPTQRGVYTGAIGYFGFDGSMDTNIVIRTFVVTEGRAYFQVGGGIVIDSDPYREYQETLHKARGLLAALEADGGSADR